MALEPTSAEDGVGTRALTGTLLSRNAFVASLVCVAACAATARDYTGAGSAGDALTRGFADNKVLWLCLAIAVWHLVRGAAPAVGARDLAIALPALLLAALGGGIWPWIGLGGSLCLFLTLTPAGWGQARVGVLIALAAALHEIAVNVLGELSGDALLGIDAWIAGSVSNWIAPGIAVEGSALQQFDGHMLVLVWGCSSLSNLGDALLLLWALVSLGRGANASEDGRARFVCCMLLLAGLTIALNAIRLALMAGSVETYAYLHGSDGAAWFRLGTLGITAALSGVMIWR